MLRLCFAVTLATLPAAAQERVIYGGGDPAVSTYSGVMVPHIVEQFQGAGITAYEWSGPTSGTGQNIAEIEFNPYGFAVGQSDAVLSAIEGGAPLRVYFTNIGPECFHVISKDGMTFEEAVAQNAPIHVGGELSGTAFSVRNLLTEGYGKELSAVNLVYEPATSAAAGGVGVFVQRPDPAARVYRDRADQGFRFSGIGSIDAELAGYTPLNVTIKDSGVVLGIGAEEQTFNTTCMTTVVFGYDPSKMEEGSRERRYMETLVLPKISTLYPHQMVPPAEGNWLNVAVEAINAAGSSAQAAGGSILDRLNDIQY